LDPYDRAYADDRDLFGASPEPTLLHFLDHLDRDRPVLDIGAGQGRNALAVARAGLAVDALEPSAVGRSALGRRAGREALAVRVLTAGFDAHDAPPGHHGGVLAFGLIPDLDWAGIHRLAERCVHWLAPGGLLFVTGFTTEDPAVARFRAEWREIGPGSFADPSGLGGDTGSPGTRIRTYLAPDQILTLFPSLAVLHHQEGLGPEHRHGDGPPERHGRFEVVLQAPQGRV